MHSDARVVLCNCPDRGSARRLAATLVERRLAACVNVIDAVESFYWWQGEMQQDKEHTLVIKTTADAYPALESVLRAEHPDQVPEIIALPVERGLRDYLEWLRTTVAGR